MARARVLGMGRSWKAPLRARPLAGGGSGRGTALEQGPACAFGMEEVLRGGQGSDYTRSLRTQEEEDFYLNRGGES